MPSYYTSQGERLSKTVIDYRIRKAKEEKLSDGNKWCESCGTTEGYIDCSHIISVDRCQKIGKSELAYDVKNILRECRSCHIIHESRPFNQWPKETRYQKKLYIRHDPELYNSKK